MKTTDPFEAKKLPRSSMAIIFAVDTSGSMSGVKIASLNTATREALNDVSEISKNNADARIKVGVLEFSSDARWMYEGLTDAESFQWQDLTAGGMTSLGAACNELNQKLSRTHGWMAEPTGTRAPVIIFISDGEPTDEWRHSFETLKGNNWYKVACKIAIAVGDDANKNILAELTGTMETVITVHDTKQLKKIIRTVSLTSSMINSKSTGASASALAGTTPATDTAHEVIGAITNDINSDPSLEGVDIGNASDNAGTDNWDW